MVTLKGINIDQTLFKGGGLVHTASRMLMVKSTIRKVIANFAEFVIFVSNELSITIL